jgi:hypothetical protein
MQRIKTELRNKQTKNRIPKSQEIISKVAKINNWNTRRKGQ